MEEYEAAQAMKDAIKDFLNPFLETPITDEDVLKLPDYKEIKVRAIVCYGLHDDPTGIGSGGAELI